MGVLMSFEAQDARLNALERSLEKHEAHCQDHRKEVYNRLRRLELLLVATAMMVGVEMITLLAPALSG